MDAALTALWTGLLPTGVRFSAGFDTDELSTSELRYGAAFRNAGTLRAREFALGRWHAGRALHQLGFTDVPLPRQDDGAPAWPEGVVGSIAHTVEQGHVFAVAAVAPRALLTAIGIDIEAPGRIGARAWPSLLTSLELARVVALEPVDRAQEVLALWCAKEAVAKAMRPRCEIEAIVIEHDRLAARFVAQLPTEADPAVSDASPGLCVGRVLHRFGWTCAVATRAGPEPSHARPRPNAKA
jgi:enterobactin synthetase component D